MNGRFTLKELKRILKEQINMFPQMYDGEQWVDVILSYDNSLDEKSVYTEWLPAGITNDGVAIMKISNFAFLK